MSFLQGFAEAATDKWDKEAETKQKKEAWKYQTDYRLNQEHVAKERERNDKYSRDLKAGENTAKARGLSSSASRAYALAFADGTPEKILTQMLNPSNWTTPDAKLSKELEAQSSGIKVPSHSSPLARSNMSEREIDGANTKANATAIVAKSAGVDAQQLHDDINGPSGTDTGETLNEEIFRPPSKSDADLMAAIRTWPLDDPLKMRALEVAYFDSGTPEGLKFANHIGKMRASMIRTNNIPDGRGHVFNPKTNRFVTGELIGGQWKPDGSDSSVPLNAVEGIFATNKKLDSKALGLAASALKPYNEKMTALRGTVEQAAEAISIVDNNRDALAIITSAVSGVESIAREWQAVLNIADGATSTDWAGAWNTVASNFLNNSAFENVPGAKRLAEIKLSMVHAKLQAMGQSGNGISNKDIELQMNTVFSRNPENFGNHLTKGINTNIKSLESMRQVLNKTNGLFFAQENSWNFMINKPVSEQMRGDFEESNYNRDLDVIMGYINKNDKTVAIGANTYKESEKTKVQTPKSALDFALEKKDDKAMQQSFEGKYNITIEEALENPEVFKAEWEKINGVTPEVTPSTEEDTSGPKNPQVFTTRPSDEVVEELRKAGTPFSVRDKSGKMMSFIIVDGVITRTKESK